MLERFLKRKDTQYVQNGRRIADQDLKETGSHFQIPVGIRIVTESMEVKAETITWPITNKDDEDSAMSVIGDMMT